MEKKYALIIGISKYENLVSLDNAINDAELLNETFRELSFETDIHINLDRDALYSSIKLCRDKIIQSNISVFYFAGHGMQSNGKNYLIPSDAKIESEDDIIHYSISLDLVLNCFSFGVDHKSIIILDACRNNPFKAERGIDISGLAYVEAGTNFIICFSTSPGKLASDGIGDNSPYAESLAKILRNKNMTLLQQLCENRNCVLGLTSGHQLPWESVSLLKDFYLHDPFDISNEDIYMNIAYGIRNSINNYIPKLFEYKMDVNETTEGGEVVIHLEEGVAFHINKHTYGEMGQFNIEYFIFNGRPIICTLFSMRYKVPMYLPEFKISESAVFHRELVIIGNKVYYDSGENNELKKIDIQYINEEFNKYNIDFSNGHQPDWS